MARLESFTAGARLLKLEFGDDGNLRRVVLDDSPPSTLSKRDLIRALSFLVTLPAVPPKSLAESNFRDALNRIKPGATRTYGEVARELGTAPRAIASRCAANPLLLHTPCHRVVAQNGIGGFQYGQQWKALLLETEREFAYL